MKLNELALDPSVIKKSAKIVKAFEKAIRAYDKNAVVEFKARSAFVLHIESDMTKFFHPEDIAQIWSETKYEIEKADVDGHIHKLEEDGVGNDFVEAILSGLKPGMVVRADAFFPLIGYDITWKQIVSKGKMK